MQDNEYLDRLKQRIGTARGRISRKFQLLGLEIAGLLGDEEHKSLYMKMAKEGDGDALLALAKDVADRRQVKDKGAYFMRIVTGEGAAKVGLGKKAVKRSRKK